MVPGAEHVLPTDPLHDEDQQSESDHEASRDALPRNAGGTPCQSGGGGAAAQASPPATPRGFGEEPLRRGKWTSEEENYVGRIISDFSTGLLPVAAGTTLRSYLSEKLNCDPMRITKKFTGASSIGKRVFHPVGVADSACSDAGSGAAARVAHAQAQLLALEAAFRVKLSEQRLDGERAKDLHYAKAKKDRSTDPTSLTTGQGCGLAFGGGGGLLLAEDQPPSGAVSRWVTTARALLQSDLALAEVERLLFEGEALAHAHGFNGSGSSCSASFDARADATEEGGEKYREEEEEEGACAGGAHDGSACNRAARAFAHAATARPRPPLESRCRKRPRDDELTSFGCSSARPDTSAERAAGHLLVDFIMQSFHK
jgi:hypothetical protein